ncbi:hypothetical protein D9M70_563370 [compost metagenome]
MLPVMSENGGPSLGSRRSIAVSIPIATTARRAHADTGPASKIARRAAVANAAAAMMSVQNVARSRGLIQATRMAARPAPTMKSGKVMICRSRKPPFS